MSLRNAAPARRPRVLVLLDYYLPGYKSGGPLRTIGNMVERLGDRLDMRILTRDRDATDTAPYAGVPVGAWVDAGGAQVFYAPPGGLGAAAIRARAAEAAPDTIYLNSFFSPLTVRALALRRAGLLPPAPVVIAPRGELAEGALSLKWPKKRAYMAAARAAGLYSGLTWQASSDDEVARIRRVVGDAPVRVAPDLPGPLGPEPPPAPPKGPGRLRLVYLARVAAVKNLHFLLELLPLLRAEAVELAIYGPLRDPAYWERCRALLAGLPPHIVARHHGPVAHDGVAAALAGAHAYALPTLGENFGHAILEALAAGRPALVSDRTPWRGLEGRRAGWDLPLEHGPWLAALQRLADMGQAEYDQWSRGARRHAAAFVAAPALDEATLALFDQTQRAYEAAPAIYP